MYERSCASRRRAHWIRLAGGAAAPTARVARAPPEALYACIETEKDKHMEVEAFTWTTRGRRGLVGDMPVVGRPSSVCSVPRALASPTSLSQTTMSKATYELPLPTVRQERIAAFCPAEGLPAAVWVAGL